MPKQLKKIEDFDGGTNGYFDPQNIADNELAQCSGFKPDAGELIVLGDMKAAYTLGTGDTATSVNIDIEAGYGLFTFSHDYDMSATNVAVLNTTNYFVLMSRLAADKHNRFDIYDDVLHTWRTDKIDLGGSASNTRIPSIFPCFFFVDGALRISPGYLKPTASGAVLNSDTVDVDTIVGEIDQINTTDSDDYLTVGDLVEIDGIEGIVAFVHATYVQIWKNITGFFTGSRANDSAVNILLDTRWRGILKRKNFKSVTMLGTFIEWYGTFMHPRAPLINHLQDYTSSISSLMVEFENKSTSCTLKGHIPLMHIGIEVDTPNTATGDDWGINIALYVTLLYDDIRQESQPRQISASTATTRGSEVAVWVGVEYSDDGSNYEINKRITGGRLYYQDITTGDTNLYQLLEIDFEKGCRKAEEESYSSWERWANADGGSDSDYAAACPASEGAAQDGRTGSQAFIFPTAPKLFTYEINTGYGMEITTHARFKTAVVANRRLYVGNVYQDGKANGDKMLKSPVNKFDLLPSINSIEVTTGDGDEIVKLEAFADRLLQFKKRTLYIINIGGDFEFLESQHPNMGVENPSQVCKMEYGIAWVNKFGVHMYDGQKIIELTRGKLKLADTTDRARALNVVEDKIPLIGYHSLNKWIVVHIAADPSGSFESEAWIYDFKNGSWTWSQEFSDQTTADPPVAVADYKTNLINTHDNELVFAAGTNSSNAPDFFKLQASTNAITTAKLFLLTKDFTLDIPSVKKNIYGIFVTYSANASTAIQAELIYKTSAGSTTVTTTSASGLYHDTNGFQSTSEAKATIELTPSSAISNAYSIQFKLYNQDATYQAADKFKLYNISFRYRTKGVH